MFKDDIYSIIKSLTGQNNILTAPKEFVRITGSANTAILLSQIIYWSERTSNENGWFYKSDENWEEELCFNKYYIRKSVKKLKELDFIETKVKRIYGNPTLHYRIKIQSVTKTFLQTLQKRNYKVYNFNNKTKNINKEYNHINNDFEPKKKLTKKQLSNLKKYKNLSSNLASIIQSKRKINKNSNISSWVKPIQDLVEKDLNINNTKIKDRVKRVQQALDWYSDHIGEKYVPVIQSGESLRSKFDKLENAMDRDKSDNESYEAASANDHIYRKMAENAIID